MLVEPKDFTGKFYIPNAEDTAPLSDLVGNNDSIIDYIEQYIEECLVLTLGFTLYSELKAELDPDGNLPFTADQKWQDLVNGVDKYDGLKNILVPYIFYWFTEDDNFHYAGTGVQQEKGKGAEMQSFRQKAVKAYRTFVKHAQGSYNKPIYFEKLALLGNTHAVGVIWNNDDDKKESLYTFLNNNIGVYDTAAPSVLKNMNYHGV